MKITIEQIRSMKNNENISVLTAYDYSTASIMDGSVDIILVGDSLGMVILGEKDTTKVTMDDMIRHTKAVSNAVKSSLIVSDLPKGSYDNVEDAIFNSRKLLDSGADAVKLENMNDIAKALTKEGINVMGHVGLTPQTITEFKVQGKDDKARESITDEAISLENAGCFSIVLECIPKDLGEEISKKLSIPTIGIGAGAECDGQVLVVNDMLGTYDKFKPRFVRRFANLSEVMKKAFEDYSKEVKEKNFPNEEESFH